MFFMMPEASEQTEKIDPSSKLERSSLLLYPDAPAIYFLESWEKMTKMIRDSGNLRDPLVFQQVVGPLDVILLVLARVK